MPVEFTWSSPDEAMGFASEWAELMTRTGADVWFGPVWVDSWARHVGRGRKVMVLAARQNGALVGVLPFAIDRIWAGPVPIRLAQLAGSNSMYGVLALPVEAAQFDEIFETAIHDLLTRHKCDCIGFAPVSELHGLSGKLRSVIDRTPGVVVDANTHPRMHTLIPLPETFDAYLARLSGNRRNKYRKTKRILEQEHGVATRVLAGAEITPIWDRFLNLHNRQWEEIGKLGHFADWPGSAEFYTDLCRRDERAVRMYVQENAEGELICANFCFVTKETCHDLVPARDEGWSSMSGLNIGLHAQFERIELLIGEGVGALDHGIGEYDYKASLKGETPETNRLLIAGDSVRKRLSMTLLRSYANLLDLVFYRIWYNRIAPKLRLRGWKAGPLRKSWIRTRV